MTTDPERLNKLTMELRRGLLVLAVLEALTEPHYGYSLRRHLAQSNLEEDEGTLYPLLRRLESQELLTSEWLLEEGRKRRVYRLASEGKEARRVMTVEWQSLNRALQSLMESKR